MIRGKTLRFCNLKGYKMYDSCIVARKALLAWAKANAIEERLVVVYAIYAPFLKAVVDVKKRYSSIKILLIVPDLQEYMRHKTSRSMKLLKSVQQIFLNQWYDMVDYYVLLSKHMIERLPVGDKPWTVIEGIFNPNRSLEADFSWCEL